MKVNFAFLGHALVIVISVAGAFAYFVNPVREDVRSIMHPQTGYPAAVRQGVADALKAAIREDKVVKLEVQATVDAALQTLIRDNTEALVQIRAELATNRESMTAAIAGQTEKLSNAIGRLEGEMSRVRSTQNILLQRLGVEVPDDPNSYWKEGLWKDAPYSIAPMWIIERKEYDFFTDPKMIEKILYQMQPLPGSRE